jgi:hypothetical protein
VGLSIKVKPTLEATGWRCEVKIEEDGRTVTEHVVQVTRSDQQRLGPNASVEDLVTRSFEFLLVREPPRSILRRFSLSDIETYFPDYPQTIRG